MATDYDAPRRRAEDELETDSLEGLKAAENASNGMDDDGEIVEPFDLPSVDLSGEELNVTVVPRREDDFTCSSCFLNAAIVFLTLRKTAPSFALTALRPGSTNKAADCVLRG